MASDSNLVRLCYSFRQVLVLTMLVSAQVPPPPHPHPPPPPPPLLASPLRLFVFVGGGFKELPVLENIRRFALRLHQEYESYTRILCVPLLLIIIGILHCDRLFQTARTAKSCTQPESRRVSFFFCANSSLTTCVDRPAQLGFTLFRLRYPLSLPVWPVLTTCTKIETVERNLP